MKKLCVKLLILSVLIIILYYITLELTWYFLNEFSPTKNSVFLGIALFYGKILFSIITIISTFTWLIKMKTIRLLLIFTLFIVYLFNWYSSLFIYPYRISLLIMISAFFYGILHFYIFFRMKKQ